MGRRCVLYKGMSKFSSCGSTRATCVGLPCCMNKLCKWVLIYQAGHWVQFPRCAFFCGIISHSIWQFNCFCICPMGILHAMQLLQSQNQLTISHFCFVHSNNSLWFQIDCTHSWHHLPVNLHWKVLTSKIELIFAIALWFNSCHFLVPIVWLKSMNTKMLFYRTIPINVLQISKIIESKVDWKFFRKLNEQFMAHRQKWEWHAMIFTVALNAMQVWIFSLFCHGLDWMEFLIFLFQSKF